MMNDRASRGLTTKVNEGKELSCQRAAKNG